MADESPPLSERLEKLDADTLRDLVLRISITVKQRVRFRDMIATIVDGLIESTADAPPESR